MSRWFQAIHGLLQRAGESIARAWLAVAALFLFAAFFLCGFAASILLGVAAAAAIGGGTPGLMALVLVALAVGLFLSIYVWDPHVGPAVARAAEELST